MSQSFRVLTMALALCGVLAADARGQQLLEVDGIELLGEAHLVLSGGGTCNVLESDTRYEDKQENHGAPMDVWRLDFSVRNGSGRWLDHVIARFQIASQWPDCTNWDGPEAGTFPQNIEWADSIGTIQESGRNVVAPGQVLTETRYFIVLRGDPEPRFSNWSMDFDFAAGPPTADAAAGGSGAESGAAAQGAGGARAAAPAGASQLPPDIQADLYLRQAEQAAEEGDAGRARAAMERLETLQREHALEPSPEDHYRYAQAWAAAEEPERAVASAVRYLQLQGREAEHYTEALDLMSRAESGDAGRPAGSASASAAGARGNEPRTGFSADQTCAGKPEGSQCFRELANQPECYVWDDDWDDFFGTRETVTWTGECAGGLAQGTGTFAWARDGGENIAELTGLLQDGKRHGPWVERFASGDVYEGSYVDGKQHGHWIWRFASGDFAEGPYVDGKRHGHWVSRYADGQVQEGLYVDGDEHGHWVIRFADGQVQEGPYVDGRRHGRWVIRFASGNTETVTYVNGVRQDR